MAATVPGVMCEPRRAKLGLGDAGPTKEWRLLPGMVAANGFPNFGQLTALLIEALRQIRLGRFEHQLRLDK